MKKFTLILAFSAISLLFCPGFQKSPYFAFLIGGSFAYHGIKANHDTWDYCKTFLGEKRTLEDLQKCYETERPKRGYDIRYQTVLRGPASTK